MGIKHNLFIDIVYNNNGPLGDLEKPIYRRMFCIISLFFTKKTHLKPTCYNS